MPEPHNNAKGRMLALQSLDHSPGWEVFCERFDAIVAKEIDAKIFDTKTPDAECRNLREARKLLSAQFTPTKMLSSMIVQAQTEAEREERERLAKEQK